MRVTMVTLPKPNNFRNSRAQIIVFNYVNDPNALLTKTGDAIGFFKLAFRYNSNRKHLIQHIRDL